MNALKKYLVWALLPTKSQTLFAPICFKNKFFSFPSDYHFHLNIGSGCIIINYLNLQNIKIVV